MDTIKRQISFEPSTVRNNTSIAPYGTMTADTFYIKVLLTQNMDNMGIYTDVVFEEKTVNSLPPDYTVLINKLSLSGITFPFMTGTQPQTPTGNVDNSDIRVSGKELEDYWAYASKISGYTDSKKVDVRSYSKTQNYITNFDVNKEIYTNYLGNQIDGVTRVTEQNVDSTTYTFDANNDNSIGTINQTTGLLYNDSTNKKQSRVVVDEFGNTIKIPLTKIEYTGEGWNETNTSLSAITKEEYLFGITERPEVQSDVFIDRGDTTVFEKHLRFSEIESLEHLEKYNNGFYNLVKQ